MTTTMMNTSAKCHVTSAVRATIKDDRGVSVEVILRSMTLADCSCCRHGLVPRQNPVDKSMTLVNRKQIAPQLSCQNFRSLLKTPPSRSWAWYTLYGSFSKPSLITVQNLVVSYSVGVCRDRLTSQMGGCDLPNC